MPSVSSQKMHHIAHSPWLVAAIDVASFVAAWLVFAAFIWNADTIDLTYFFGALILPAAIVVWWGLGWVNERAAGKASVKAAAVQGGLWGTFLAALTFLLFVVLGSTVTARDRLDSNLLLDLSFVLLKQFLVGEAMNFATLEKMISLRFRHKRKP
jgi:uncharacterized integral membrane protein